MITCTFIGSEQFELDLYPKIQAAVQEVVSKENEIEFLFFRKSEDFYILSYFAVLQAKYQFPDKKITMTLFTIHGREVDTLLTRRVLIQWLFDKVIPLLLRPTIREPDTPTWEKIERRIIRRSDYVIACCYPEISWEQRPFRYAIRQQKCVLNLLNKETSQFFRETMKALPEGDRAIFEELIDGCTFAGAARANGVSARVIHTIDSRCRRYLLMKIENWLNEERAKRGPTPPKTYSEILPSKTTGELLKRSYFITDLLASSMGGVSFVKDPWDSSVTPDFLICNLGGDKSLNPHSMETRQGLTVIDIGKSPLITEPQELV